MNKQVLITIIYIICSFSISFAQNQPSEKLEYFVEKKMQKNGVRLSAAHRLKAKDYSTPKKIGILVFGVTSANEYTASDGYYNYYKRMSEDGANIVAQAIHDESIAAIKENYSKQGIEVYTPDEYLDTYAKREAFKTMDMRILGPAKLLASVTNPGEIGLPDGYKYITNSYYHSDIGGRADIADELKMFGMNGYLSIFIEFYGPETLYNVRTSLILFKDRDYVSKIKKETYRRTDITNNMLAMGTTEIEAASRDELRNQHKGKRDVMIHFENEKVWIDPNLAKLVSYSADLYFPMVK